MSERNAQVVTEEYKAARAAGNTAKADQLYGELMRLMGQVPNSSAFS